MNGIYSHSALNMSLLSVGTITDYYTSNLIAEINIILLQPLKLVRSSQVPTEHCTYCPSNLNRIFLHPSGKDHINTNARVFFITESLHIP